jgi:phospholipase C
MMRVLQPSLLLTLVGIASGLPAGSVDGRSSSAIPDINQTAALEALGKTAADFRLLGSLPNPDYEAGTDMLPGIEYIVMLMMENHSFDNIWGTLDREDVDGFTLDSDGNPIETQEYANGTVQHLYVMPNTCNSDNNGPTQNWLSSHEQYDNGSMDGFVVGGGYKPISMGYYTEEQLPFTHSLGQTFPISDRFFCSLLGQTWPNRMYLMAGTSMGIVDTDQWSALIQVAPSGTIFDTLDNYDIGWVNYASEYVSPHYFMFRFSSSKI